MGSNSYVNHRCFFDNAADIIIGDECAIGMGVTFVTSVHFEGNHKRRAGKASSGEIIIGNGVWIGANSTLLPHVIVEDGCVVAAGSVVTKRCHADGLYGGVPARRIKELK